MDKFATYTVLGLATSAIYAVAASGLVVTYTTSGIFNFAHGAFGMLGAFLYWQLRVDWGWPAPVALFFVLLVAAPLFGAFTERVVFRRLQGVSEVVRISVSVSLLLALSGVAKWIWSPDVNRNLAPFFGDDHKLKILGTFVTYHQLIAMGVAVGVALLLRFVLYGTRIGVSMRAVVDDRPLARLNGSRPDRAAMFAWALGAGLAAISGILNAPLQSLSVDVLTLLIVNAFAAAIVGRLRSLPLTFAGAVILGLGRTYAIGYLGSINAKITGSLPWQVVARFFVENSGPLRESLPAILLFVVLLVLPHERLRGLGVQRSREMATVPSVRSAAIGGALLVAFTAAVAPMFSSVNILFFAQVFGWAIIVLSLVPLTGLGGQVSLAQLTFAGLGAIAMGKWSLYVVDHHLPAGWTLLGVVLAAVLAGAIGAIVALPALRLQGIYLALATAAFAVFMFNVVFNRQDLFPNGSLSVPRAHPPGLSLRGDVAYTTALAIVFVLLGIAIVVLRRGRFGRRLQAMKDSSVACATLGLSLTRTKLTLFAMSAAIAGVGGALFAGITGTATPNDFQFFASLPVTMIAVVGGVGAVTGALVGGVALTSFSAMQAVFAVNAIGLFKFFEARILDVVKPLPGFIGVSLGRNPNGAAAQIAIGYRPVAKSRPASILAVSVTAALVALTRAGAIEHWSFFVALVVFAFGVVPFLPAIVARTPSGRGAVAAAFLAAVTATAAFGDWDGWVAGNGYRVLIAVAGVAVTILATPRLLEGGGTGDTSTSPDWIAAERPFETDDAERADVALGLGGEVIRRELALR